MKKNVFQRVVCMLLSVTLLLGAVSVTSFAAAGSASGEKLKVNGTAATLEEMQALVGTVSYKEYIESYANSTVGSAPEVIYVFDVDNNNRVEGSSMPSNGSGNQLYVSESADCKTEDWENFYTDASKSEDNALFLPTTVKDGNNVTPGSATWTFNVTKEQQGFYYLYIEYYNPQITDPNSTSKSSVSSIQKKLYIDGKVPFDEVGTLIFDKHWSYNNYKEGTPEPTTATEASSKIRYEERDDGYYKIVDLVYKEGNNWFKRTDTYKMTQDINGNSMSPLAEESSEWSTFISRDASGFEEGYFKFYLPYGTRTFTLESEREPMIIKSIRFVPAAAANAENATESLDYEDYLKNSIIAAAPSVSGDFIRLEAEFPDFVSDSSVLPGNSNDNAANYPIKAGAQMFNVIGKTSYDAVGQWAAYKFTVNKTGLYKINMRYKQSALEGMFICRTLKLVGGNQYKYGLEDGTPTVPFAQADQIRFDYNKDWQSDYLGDGTHDYFEFYFEAGEEYTMYLECSLGDLSNYIKKVEDALNELNEAYLKILQRTGASPDANTSYDFHKAMPEVLNTLIDSATTIEQVIKDLEAICGTKGSHLATLETIVRLLQEMGANYGVDIAANLTTFKSHLGTLGSWVNDSKKGTLIVDSINIVPTDASEDTLKKLPKAKAGFFKSFGFEISSFIHSFFTDYDQMGLTEIPEEGSTTVDVWLATGRDQSQIWRTMIDADDGFTDTYGHAVALKLVTAGTLLPSILAGKGPDVYLGLGSSDVINYAIRDAVLAVDGTAGQNGTAEYEFGAEDAKYFTTNYYKDASGNVVALADKDVLGKGDYFDSLGYTSISKSYMNTVCDLEHSTASDLASVNDKNTSYNFAPAAMNTLTLLDQTFGVPQTMSFAMMFYRMDVLAEIGKEVPETWDQLLDILPDLQMSNMTIGVTYVNALDFMMYQRGGNMWKFVSEEYDSKYAGAKIDLDSRIALDAFEFVCNLYTMHSLPVTFDSSNRFRTGEMPIVIGDYISIYNTLAVFATEIGGLWEFSSLPGSENDDGSYNYDSLASVTATVIPAGCDNIDAAWSFIQWQTGSFAQSTYGNRIVAVVGPAAKYETANLNAIEDLSWTASEKAAIRDQMANLNAIVNYPGSYIIARYMKFAFLDAYNNGANPTEAMMSYIEAINGEIVRKRQEFELPVIEENDDEALKENNQ
ncbi:MAG: extracellular solute-binding protein [Clostridia bacterium]|nr:extracellular solute-binding protein [Clostridia bacterium]